MKKDLISERLEQIICIYTNCRKIEPDIDLLAKPISLPPHDMAALFLDIEKEFGIDLNKLVPDLAIFTPSLIAKKIGVLSENRI
ncbi:hypothetical protein [Lachnoclostridium phytofermentans]|uniref:hypothetical protein n=1 Tax=Lachnoclostridium phytofermentans TaxID=66219 RepID=UPI0005A2CB0A|nr:hypothetical protein [Lachnoclostridium phytofermentans]